MQTGGSRPLRRGCPCTPGEPVPVSVRRRRRTRKKQVTPESPEQSGSESSVQSRDSFGPQQLSGDLSGRHPQGRSGRAGVVGAAKDGAGAAHLQRGHHTGHHPLLCRWGEGWTTQLLILHQLPTYLYLLSPKKSVARAESITLITFY